MLVARNQLSYYPEEALEVKSRPKKDVKKQEQRKKRNNSFAKLIILSIPMFILGISLLILFRYANITSIRRDITELERNKVQLEKTKMDLIGELEGIKSSAKIEEDAIMKLGMNYPAEGQIVYISVTENIMEQAEKPSIGKQFKKIFSMVSSLF